MLTYYAPCAAAFEVCVKAVIATAGGYNIKGHFEYLPQLIRDAFIHRTASANEIEAREKLRSFDLHVIMN